MSYIWNSVQYTRYAMYDLNDHIVSQYINHEEQTSPTDHLR